MNDRAPPTAVISECPPSHSYPLFGNGKFCCKWYRRINDTSKHPLCDGGILMNTDPLECCIDGDYEVCDGGRAHCKQIVDYSKHCFPGHWSLQHKVFTFLIAHCPRYPDILRREGYDSGYDWIGTVSHIVAEEACSAQGAFLPLSSDDMMTNDIAEDVKVFMPWSNLATGITQPIPPLFWHICKSFTCNFAPIWIIIIFNIYRLEATCWCKLYWSWLWWATRVVPS